MTKTIPSKDIERPVIGYMLNAELSTENQQKIAILQKQLSEKFGKAIWNTPTGALHITLFDWLAPLVDYDQDKEKLFAEIFPEYDHVVGEAIKNTKPITIKFNAIKVAPGAIFIVGQDAGEFEQIRNDFVSNVELLPNTKRPPTIIHSTVSRFLDEVELEQIEEFLHGLDVSFVQTIASFRLVKETVDPLLDFEVIKEYKLGI